MITYRLHKITRKLTIVPRYPFSVVLYRDAMRDLSAIMYIHYSSEYIDLSVALDANRAIQKVFFFA